MRLDSIDIMSVWSALGGGELRGRRGKAFWRKGDGYNVDINTAKNVWYDHRDAVGGGVLDLVTAAMGCDQAAALRWLQDNVGLDRPSGKAAIPKTDDRRAARRWAIATEALADTLLETMETEDPERFTVTEIRRIARSRGPELLTEFRAWRESYPDLARAMVRAGLQHEERVHRGLAQSIKEEVADAA